MSPVSPEGPRPVGASIPRLLDRLGAPVAPATLDALFSRWDEVAGPELAPHVRPQRLEGTTLVVAVDHAAWATRTRVESGRILAALRAIGEVPLERVQVVVARP
jgi:predicted nucleic acid-binding Zn ribbon protein